MKFQTLSSDGLIKDTFKNESRLRRAPSPALRTMDSHLLPVSGVSTLLLTRKSRRIPSASGSARLSDMGNDNRDQLIGIPVSLISLWSYKNGTLAFYCHWIGKCIPGQSRRECA